MRAAPGSRRKSASSPVAGEQLTYAWSFSDGTTLDGATVTHVFAHLDQFSAGDVESLGRNAMLEELGRDGSVVLYRVRGVR